MNSTTWKICTMKTIEHWWKKLKTQTKRQLMLINWNTAKSVHTLQSDQQIQCNPYQNSKGIFYWTAKAILRKKKSEASYFLISNYITKLQYSVVIKRHIYQWNRLESPEINAYIYGKLIFSNDIKNL